MSEDKKQEKRRNFMKRVAALTAAATVAGIGTDTRGQPQPLPQPLLAKRAILPEVRELAPARISRLPLTGSDRALAETLGLAMRTLDVKEAIETKGQNLQDSDRQMLLQLNERDLADLNFVINKLPASRDPSTVGVVGVIIF